MTTGDNSNTWVGAIIIMIVSRITIVIIVVDIVIIVIDLITIMIISRMQDLGTIVYTHLMIII